MNHLNSAERRPAPWPSVPESEGLKAIKNLGLILELNPSSLEKLWLPFVFVRALDRQALPDIMLCEASRDQPWMAVDTVIDDLGHGHFEAGWPEFAFAYRLQPFDKLELRYNGHHRFTIKVFDYGGHRCRYKDWVDGLGAVPIELGV